MIDFHCHLDLYERPLEVLNQVKHRCKFVLAVTTSPKAWIKTKEYFSSVAHVPVALGIHPEIVQSKINELELMISNIWSASYIGEVGIDGSSQYKASLPLQRDTFNNILTECEQAGGRILSIHSRNASKDVLRSIESTISSSTHILHWFSGSKKELEWAIDLGCWFSINQIMLLGEKGLRLIKEMPVTRILPETDGPFTVKNGVPYMPWDAMDIVSSLANIHGVTDNDMRKQLLVNTDMIKQLVKQPQGKNP